MPIMLGKEATVLDAIKKMQDFGCGILPVGDPEQVIGVVTDRDIMIHVEANKIDISQKPITDVMSRGVTFCNEADSLQHAIRQMNFYNRRRVLIKNSDSVLSGILSLGDIMRRTRDKSLLVNLFFEKGK